MNRHFLKSLLTVVILAFASEPAPVWAQNDELQSLVSRLERLERDINALNIQVARGKGQKGAPAGIANASGPESVITSMEVRIGELESELRAATGNAEETAHQLAEMNRRLDKLISDMDYRLGALEGLGTKEGLGAQERTGGATPGAAASHPAKPPSTGPSPSAAGATPQETIGTITQGELTAAKKQEAKKEEGEQQQREGGQKEAPAQLPSTQAATAQAAKTPAGALPAGSPKDRYNYAFTLMRQSKYSEAEAALREFLESHGDDELAANARYWLGETFYVRNDFRSAAQTFIEGYRKNPKGAKAPDTLMKLGMSLSKLDKKNEACATFSKLLKDFSTLPSNMAKMAEKEREAAGCK